VFGDKSLLGPEMRQPSPFACEIRVLLSQRGQPLSYWQNEQTFERDFLGANDLDVKLYVVEGCQVEVLIWQMDQCPRMLVW